MSKLGKISFLVSGVSVIVLFAARLIIEGWINLLYVPLGLALVAFVAAFVVDYKFYLEFLAMRTTKHGMNMGVMIILALVLTIAVNFLGVRFDKSFDLTKEKINTLSDQSVEMVKKLTDDMNVFIFYKGGEFKDAAREIKMDFHLYTAASSHVKVEVVDANVDVERAKKYLENAEGFAIVAEYKGRKAVIQPTGGSPMRPVYQEKEITSSFMKITRDKPMTVYFFTGHGEKDIDQSSVDGIKIFAEALRDDGYTVAKLNLLTGDKMPEPPAVVAIVGPKMSYADKELEQIRDFAKNGGRLFIAIDPGENHHMALLTKTFGVEFRNNYVVNDVQGIDEGRVGAVGIEFDAASEVTKKLAHAQALAVFPLASELAKAPDAPSEYTIREIVKSHAEGVSRGLAKRYAERS